MDRNIPSSVSIVDMSNVDDIGNMFEKLVSRQSKFTKEFEKNMEICCTQLKKLTVNNNNNSITLLNSMYNVNIKAKNLKKLQSEYEICSVCKSIKHAPLMGLEQPTEKLRKNSEELSDDYIDFLKPMKSLKSRRFFFDFKHSTVDTPKPEIIKKEASNIFIDQGISDYFVFLINQKSYIDNNSFKRFSLDTFKSLGARLFDFTMNVFPLFNITNFSNLIIVIQWLLFLIRALIFRSFFQKLDIEEESIRFGAFSGDLLRDNLDVHRVLSSTFFHNSFAHLIISTMMHLRFSSVFEKINGIVATIFVYLSSSAYGMICVCWLTPKTLQANGFAGDWGVAGALLSRFFLFPYLVHREYQNITNVVVSYICLFFLKTIGKGSSILVSTHLLSAIAGLCMGTMINIRSKTNKVSGLNKLLIDFVCSFTLLVVPIFSVFMLFLVKIGK